MTIEWREIPGTFGLYFVSNHGEIKSFSRLNGGVLKLRRDKDGYLRCNISVKGAHQTILVHRVVAEVFLPVKKAYEVIDHKNRNKEDNRSCNLHYVTTRQNALNREHKKRSKFFGVYYNVGKGRKLPWSALLSCNNRQIYLGSFSKEIHAARAFDEYCIKHNLDRKLNFA